jgi:hypothetical protein
VAALANKYRNRKIEADGIVFDSKKEARTYMYLKMQEERREISELKTQVKFVLIPAQYAVVGRTKTGKPKTKCVEREVAYYADFCYRDERGRLHVVDVKSAITRKNPAYIIKRKLLRQVHGIELEEV